VSVVRGIRRQELLRTAFADLLATPGGRRRWGRRSPPSPRRPWTAALGVARRSVAAELDVAELPIEFAVIAMGASGAAEVGYGSDADVMFVYDGGSDGDAARMAHDVAERMREPARGTVHGRAAGHRRQPAPGGAARAARAIA